MLRAITVWRFIVGALVGAAALVALTCSDSTTYAPSVTSTASSSGGATSTSGGSGGGGATGGFGVGGFGTGGGCELGCSADLKKVIDCQGVVVQQCPGHQACLNGACSDDPCGAAEASHSSFGCDFWALHPDMVKMGVGACFAAFVANTWSEPVHIEVSRAGQPFAQTGFIRIPSGQGASLSYASYDAVQGLPVGEVAILFLSHDTTQGTLPDCPVPAAINEESAVFGTGLGQAFNVKTDRPTVAYTILPYGGGQSAATSATLLLPTSAWGTNYVAVNAYAKSQAVDDAQPSLDILAIEDDTKVTILPKVAIVGGSGVDAAPANVAKTYTLARGQYLQLSQDQELSGSPIQADRPIGVWGAASCLNVPVGAKFCDTAHQQIPPLRALGRRYAGVRYRNRATAQGEETPPWRLMGAVDATVLSWTPSPPPGAPTTLALGGVHEFHAAGPFVVQSQDADHPFYFFQYMTGSEHVMSAAEGDPEWVNVVPIDQYLDSYVFFTDPTYSETSLVVVRRRSALTSTFEDVLLDCRGTLSGWQALADDLEYTRVDLVTGQFQGVSGCENGRHEMASPAPFGVTVWGWGMAGVTPSTQNVSYAYPAGASVQLINEVVVPPVPK